MFFFNPVLSCFYWNRLLFVKLIDEHSIIYNGHKIHNPNYPNPSNHQIIIYDIGTKSLLQFIQLPLNKEYRYGNYRCNLFWVDDTGMYIHDKEKKHYFRWTLS